MLNGGGESGILTQGTHKRTTVFECGERRVRSVLKHLIWFGLSPASVAVDVRDLERAEVSEGHWNPGFCAVQRRSGGRPLLPRLDSAVGSVLARIAAFLPHGPPTSSPSNGRSPTGCSTSRPWTAPGPTEPPRLRGRASAAGARMRWRKSPGSSRTSYKAAPRAWPTPRCNSTKSRRSGTKHVSHLVADISLAR